MKSEIVTLRDVYGKMKECHFQPGRQANGARYPFVKPVRYDSLGNSEMILSSEELNSPDRDYFIAEDEDIVVTDGTTFNLNNPLERNRWESIKNSDLIAPTRDSKDANGNLFIDGSKMRYGMAEFYVEIPGAESERSVSKKQKITKAWTYIGKDSVNGRLTKCKLLGKIMDNAPDTDVEDFLYQRAEKNPEEIINLYCGGDSALRLLLIDAKEKGIILKKSGMFMYAENVLGATDDAVLLYFKTPTNKRIVDQIKLETYPEFAISAAATAKLNEEPIEEQVDEVTDIQPVTKTKTKTSKK